MCSWEWSAAESGVQLRVICRWEWCAADSDVQVRVICSWEWSAGESDLQLRVVCSWEWFVAESDLQLRVVCSWEWSAGESDLQLTVICTTAVKPRVSSRLVETRHEKSTECHWKRRSQISGYAPQNHLPVAATIVSGFGPSPSPLSDSRGPLHHQRYQPHISSSEFLSKWRYKTNPFQTACVRGDQAGVPQGTSRRGWWITCPWIGRRNNPARRIVGRAEDADDKQNNRGRTSRQEKEYIVSSSIFIQRGIYKSRISSEMMAIRIS